jgi:hypothetical protein
MFGGLPEGKRRGQGRSSAHGSTTLLVRSDKRRPERPEGLSANALESRDH